MRALVAAAAFGLGACMGTNFVGSGTELAAFVDEGGRRVTAAERGALLAGNTLVAEGVRVYYAPDGAKLIELEDGRSIVRRWRLREDGIMCEQLTVSTAEVCVDQGILYENKGEYRAFRPDGTTAPLGFRIEPGDARILASGPASR
jgi:hypothetical protein